MYVVFPTSLIVPDDHCLGPRCNGGQGSGFGLATCLCIHAEENALLEAGRERIREGAILYCDTWVAASLAMMLTYVFLQVSVFNM